MSFFSKIFKHRAIATPAERFWIWFEDNADRFFNIPDAGDKRLFEELTTELHRASPSLTWELSAVRDGRRELVISADGHRERFPEVKKLVAMAPPFERWYVTAFRPRGSINCTITMGDVKLGPDDIWYGAKIMPAGGVELLFAIRGSKQANCQQFLNAAVVLMDGAIGEYDAVTKVIGVVPAILPQDPAREGLLPFTRLPEFIDGISAPA